MPFGQTFKEMLNLCCTHIHLEHSKATCAQDTPAYDAGPLNKVGYQRIRTSEEYNKNTQTVIF